MLTINSAARLSFTWRLLVAC